MNADILKRYVPLHRVARGNDIDVLNGRCPFRNMSTKLSPREHVNYAVLLFNVLAHVDDDTGGRDKIGVLAAGGVAGADEF